MGDEPQDQAGATPPPPAVAAAWTPSVAAPPAPRRPADAKRRPRRSSGSGALLIVLLVVAAVIGGAVFVVMTVRANDPEHIRYERTSALRGVCKGKGIDSVPAHERGEAGVIGARFVPKAREDRDEQEVVAFPLTPGSKADPDEIGDARLLACMTTDAIEQTECSFIDTSKAPSMNGGGNVTAAWATRTSTKLLIVEVHSGKVLHGTKFETANPCPARLYLNDDGRYWKRYPNTAIAEQVEGQMALFHQG